MKKRKPKQADTLETSHKVLHAALMSAVHNGGFLFSHLKNGITPVVVNATVGEMVSATLAFVFTRAKTSEEVSDLAAYVSSVAGRMQKLRTGDLAKAAEAAKAAGNPAESET